MAPVSSSFTATVTTPGGRTLKVEDARVQNYDTDFLGANHYTPADAYLDQHAATAQVDRIEVPTTSSKLTSIASLTCARNEECLVIEAILCRKVLLRHGQGCRRHPIPNKEASPSSALS